MRRFIGGVCLFTLAICLGCEPAPKQAASNTTATNAKTTSSNATSATSEKPDAEKKIADNLAKLDDEDRALAEAQYFFAVANEGRLGSMGKPFKLMINDKPVFLCCDGCQDEALADPDKTLAKVEELKEAAKKK